MDVVNFFLLLLLRNSTRYLRYQERTCWEGINVFSNVEMYDRTNIACGRELSDGYCSMPLMQSMVRRQMEWQGSSSMQPTKCI